MPRSALVFSWDEITVRVSEHFLALPFDFLKGYFFSVNFCSITLSSDFRYSEVLSSGSPLSSVVRLPLSALLGAPKFLTPVLRSPASGGTEDGKAAELFDQAHFLASNTKDPPSMVATGRMFLIWSSAQVRMSLSRTTRSASFPGSIEPLIFSSKVK